LATPETACRREIHPGYQIDIWRQAVRGVGMAQLRSVTADKIHVLS
jgi:hypothetical protein